ncbi:MAG: HPr family phosphocarrier protein [Spirochaetes bacterium]|nr:HPr family phosphocarrier protein [Spirochaetota bacterium]
MIKGTAVVQNDKGIHARPSSIISLESQKYQSDITLHHDGKTASSKDVLQIIILELFQGIEVEIVAEGEDEKEAFEAIKTLIEKTYEFS